MEHQYDAHRNGRNLHLSERTNRCDCVVFLYDLCDCGYIRYYNNGDLHAPLRTI